MPLSSIGFLRLLVLIAAPPLSAPAGPALLTGADLPPYAVWLESLNLDQAQSGFVPRQSFKKTPITIAGVVYPHGVGGGGRSELLVHLHGRAVRFRAVVGIDDCEKSNGSLAFSVWLDGRKVRDTGPMVKGESRLLSIDLTGADDFAFRVEHGGESTDWDRFGLGGAQFQMVASASVMTSNQPQVYTLEPEPLGTEVAPVDVSPGPRINGPGVVGGTSGRPFLYRVPATGQAPLRFHASGLPVGLTLAAATGIISGAINGTGTFTVGINVAGPGGRARRTLIVRAGTDTALLSPTPPMGWNSWNAFGPAVTADRVRAAADALVSSGLADHGYRFINIDDGWAGARAADGRPQASPSFGDVKALADYVHAKGLKLGIYSSPGRTTCAHFEGSYGHEEIDARTWASWGVDFLKYDWCSYDAHMTTWSVDEIKKPYQVMRAALDGTHRDIVYSLCQYGRGNVWQWGAQVGGNLWRTTSDAVDAWPLVNSIGFAQAGKESFAGPGRFNDPDMLVVGTIGLSGDQHPSHLSQNEQVLHMTHWSMLAAPLFIGADLTKLDPFTLSLLANDEVLAVDQDPLVKQASRRWQVDSTEVWTRPLADGTLAVALYNRGAKRARVTAAWRDLGLCGPQPLRDLWARRDRGTFATEFSAEVAQHGAMLIRVGRPHTVE